MRDVTQEPGGYVGRDRVEELALFVEYAEHGDREAVLAQDGEQGVELLTAGVGLALV